jgi:hypothetical protein
LVDRNEIPLKCNNLFNLIHLRVTALPFESTILR